MGLHKRKYKSYQQYINHQKKKLDSKLEYYQQKWDKRVKSFVERLAPISSKIPGNKVLCLAARLGEEVKAHQAANDSDNSTNDEN